jgi:Flp pilus assembly protein TadB
MILTRTARAVVERNPIDGWEDQQLDLVLEELQVEVTSRSLTGLATLLVAVAALVTPTVLVVPSGSRLPLVIGLWTGVTVCIAGLLIGPRLLVRSKRARALGDAPEILGLGVLRLRVSPTPEAAASFAAAHGSGPIAGCLAEEVRDAAGTPQAGWEGLAQVWGNRLPELRRGISLLTAAAAAEPADRDRLLDASLDAVLDGTRQRMARFAANLQGPTTAVYAFGVVLPLAFVGALPTLRAAGLSIGLAELVVVYVLALPGTLLCATAWLIGVRPAAFPSATVSKHHPDLPNRTFRLVLTTLFAGGLGYLGAVSLFPTWGPWIVVPGLVLGSGLVVWYHPVVSIRDTIEAIEADFPDALTVAAQSLRRRQAPETAVAVTGQRIAGPAGETFRSANKVQQRLGAGVREAFLGSHGALQHVGSQRLHSGVSLFALAAQEGPRGGSVLLAQAAHLDRLQTVETEIRRDLSSLVGTLRSTAWCFAPLIGGTTVALGTRLDGSTLPGSSGVVSGDGLATVIGLYVLLLAAILGALASGLERGVDRARLGLHIGLAVVSASILYPVAVFAASLMV